MGDDEAVSFEQQYQALRRGGGLAELVAWSSVTLSGADRQSFLHNFCTNDIKRLTPGVSCEAFFTDVKGRIVGHGLVTCREDELVVVGTPNQSPRLLEHFDRYIIREDVQVRDSTSERAYFLVAGVEINVAALIDDLPAYSIDWDLLRSPSCQLLEVIPAELPRVWQKLLDRGVVACGQAALDACRIESGTPLFGIDFDDRNFPQEVGRGREAISFTKGCYLGQETVARIDALGHVNQQLVGVRFSGSDVAPAGTELSKGGAKVGRVTSATYSPQLQAPLALAMVRRDANATGMWLESAVGECEVVDLPLAD